MKKHIYLSVLAILGLFSANSVTAVCYGRGYYQQFNALKHNVSVQNTEHRKQQLAIDFFKNNCFSVSELNQIINLMHGNDSKYNLATSAFNHLEDTLGFYTVQYVFTSNIYKSNFKAFLRWQKRGARIDHGPHHSVQLRFPNYNYPNVHIDFRRGQHINLVDNRAFYRIALRIDKTRHIVDKKRVLENYMSEYVFTTEQFMKLLSLYNNYQLRYDLAVRYHGLLYDYENAYFIEDVFDHSAYRQKFRFFMGQNTMPGRYGRNNRRPPIDHRNNNYRRSHFVSAHDMNGIIASLKNESFSSRRVELAKTIILSKQGFNSQQMAMIVGQMSFDSHKLEVAKLGYYHVVDRENYYLVSNILSFSSNRSALLKFIQRNP